MQKSEQIGDLAAALAKAQGTIKGAAKDSANPFFKSSYADLASVWEACRAALSANGLSVMQTTNQGVGHVTVITTLAHLSGQWISGELTLKPVKDDPQGIGSAITYARRYALAAMVGIAPEDDDGNAASGRNGGERAPRTNQSMMAGGGAAARTGTPRQAEDDDQRPKHGEMHGPLGITALKSAMKAFAHDLEGCADIDSLNGLVMDNKAVLDQCQRDLPDWYLGRPNSDVKGAQHRVSERITELSAPERAPLGHTLMAG